MQGSHFCCEPLGDFLQSGVLDFSANLRAWVLTPSNLKEKVRINFCPFDGEEIKEASGYCMDCEDFKFLQEDNKVFMVPIDQTTEIDNCPFCGFLLGKYEPARIG